MISFHTAVSLCCSPLGTFRERNDGIRRLPLSKTSYHCRPQICTVRNQISVSVPFWWWQNFNKYSYRQRIQSVGDKLEERAVFTVSLDGHRTAKMWKIPCNLKIFAYPSVNKQIYHVNVTSNERVWGQDWMRFTVLNLPLSYWSIEFLYLRAHSSLSSRLFC